MKCYFVTELIKSLPKWFLSSHWTQIVVLLHRAAVGMPKWCPGIERLGLSSSFHTASCQGSLCLYPFFTICVSHLRINSERLAGGDQGSVNILDALDGCYIIFQNEASLHQDRISFSFPQTFPKCVAFLFLNYFYRNLWLNNSSSACSLIL